MTIGRRRQMVWKKFANYLTIPNIFRIFAL